VLNKSNLNFLSHFYVHQQGNNPLFSTGLVFPDLARGFGKQIGKLELNQYGSLSELALGCKHHYQADKIFHSSSFFEWGTQACINQLKQAQFDTQVERKWFIGHILFELLLDRILVRHQPQVAHDFYTQLNLVSQSQLDDFISLHSFQEKDRFLKFYAHFRKAAYIRNYTDNNLFAFSLSRIILRAGLPALSLADKVVLQECVLNLENKEFKNAQSILFELKEVFK
jgi:hypothetical protein